MYMCEICGQRFLMHESLTIHAYYSHLSSPKYIYYARCTKSNPESGGVKIYIPQDILNYYKAGHRDYYVLRRLEDPSDPPAFILYFTKSPPLRVR